MASYEPSKTCEIEQTLRYWLFPHSSNGQLICEEEKLERILSEYCAHISSYTHSYIWQWDPFSLHVKMALSTDGSSIHMKPHIGGTMVVGENIEDEWFVTFLLWKLTAAFKGLVCRVTDTDGEFLLIEAAQHLPTWVDPETAEQRVYLKNGQIHLIPHTDSSSPSAEVIPVMEAVAQVNSLPSASLASPGIQNAINLKLNAYPGKISKDQHTAHAFVPVGVAALLREYPTLVSPCVRAFCRRDHLDNKTLRVMRHFPPEQRVVTGVRFSKALYAQLAAHSYQPDARTGWRLPAPTHPSYSSHLLGIKLACGFEILVCNAGGVTPGTPTQEVSQNESSSLDLVENNPRWNRYKHSLSEKGYFRGELEGSKLYQELERNARHYFVANILTSNKGNEDADELSIGAAVIKLLTKVNADYAFFKEMECKLSPQDDESWLEITPESLDELLESQYGTGPYNAPQPASEKQMMESLTAFLSHVSDANGADIPPELRPISSNNGKEPKRKTSGRKISSSSRKVSSSLLASHPQHRKVSSQSNTSQGSSASDMSSFSNKMDFNAEAFSDALNNILEFSLPEDEYFDPSDGDSSGMSSYEEDDNDISLSRKTSNGSQNSKASSGVSADFVDYVKQLERELKNTTISEHLATPIQAVTQNPKKKTIPLADLDDEFDDFEDVQVDMKAVKELMKTYAEQNGAPGPASSLLGSLGLKPSNA